MMELHYAGMIWCSEKVITSALPSYLRTYSAVILKSMHSLSLTWITFWSVIKFLNSRDHPTLLTL